MRPFLAAGLLALATTAPAAEPAPPPREASAVAELFEEGAAPFIGLLTNDTAGPSGNVVRELRDVFSGAEALKVAPQQRFRTKVPGWEFKIVEHPKGPNEYRYLRFAWKKDGGGTILLAFAIDGGQWIGRRYSAGPYDLGGSGHKVGEVAPTEWTVVTRDVFKDFGALTLNGILFSVDHAGTGYFDHILLARTVEDLDRATDAALGRAKPAAPLTAAARLVLWKDLTGTDAEKASAALRVALATAPDQVSLVEDRLSRTIDRPDPSKVLRLIGDLDSDSYPARRDATAELRKLGRAVAAPVSQAAATHPSAEVRMRAGLILRATAPKPGEVTPETAAAARVVRVLERANTSAAAALLRRMAALEWGPEYAEEARAALARTSAARPRP